MVDKKTIDFQTGVLIEGLEDCIDQLQCINRYVEDKDIINQLKCLRRSLSYIDDRVEMVLGMVEKEVK